MKTTNKKDLIKKYKFFINNLIIDFENTKQYLTDEDIKKLMKIDKLISEIIESLIKNETKELELTTKGAKE